MPGAIWWDPVAVVAVGRVSVLLSGGVDSALVLGLLTARRPRAVWIDYGQPAAEAERRASKAVASHYGAPWSQLTIGGLRPPNAGEFLGRNDLLVAAASTAGSGASIAIGIHAGTGYADCSPEWASAWQGLLDTQHQGRAALLAPLCTLTKTQVYELARETGVPTHLTHSCESGAMPCGSCSSCADRRYLDARP
jgi:7-cyano-7-deazaguanine synthase